MFKKTYFTMALAATLFAATNVTQAFTSVPINGTVQSRCVIQTDNAGTFGNPNAYTLSTARSDGGEDAVVRFDVSLANAYYATITAPTSFSSSPTLPDSPIFIGNTTVKAVSDATGMGTYESSKIELGMTDKYELTAAGSVWFATSSKATMGGNKAFPGGNYTALIVAECIAK
jgi:hypothetical protein